MKKLKASNGTVASNIKYKKHSLLIKWLTCVTKVLIAQIGHLIYNTCVRSQIILIYNLMQNVHQHDIDKKKHDKSCTTHELSIFLSSHFKRLNNAK